MRHVSSRASRAPWLGVLVAMSLLVPALTPLVHRHEHPACGAVSATIPQTQIVDETSHRACHLSAANNGEGPRDHRDHARVAHETSTEPEFPAAPCEDTDDNHACELCRLIVHASTMTLMLAEAGRVVPTTAPPRVSLAPPAMISTESGRPARPRGPPDVASAAIRLI